MKYILVLSIILATACGESTTTQTGIGFDTPTETLEAYREIDGEWVLQGPANLDCLNTASEDQPSTVEIALDGKVEDFQTGDPVPGAEITAFNVAAFSTPIANAISDQSGNAIVTLPVGVERVGFLVIAPNTLDTYSLNQYYNPNNVNQADTWNSVSVLTANALPAFIGVARTPGLGIQAGQVADCNGHMLRNAIATVSSVSGEAVPLEQGDDIATTYYFSAQGTELPVRHNVIPATNDNGLFVVIELPPDSGEAFLQVWGFLPGQDPASDDLTLISEIPAPVLADSVVTADLRPLRAD